MEPRPRAHLPHPIPPPLFIPAQVDVRSSSDHISPEEETARASTPVFSEFAPGSRDRIAVDLAQQNRGAAARFVTAEQAQRARWATVVPEESHPFSLHADTVALGRVDNEVPTDPITAASLTEKNAAPEPVEQHPAMQQARRLLGMISAIEDSLHTPSGETNSELSRVRSALRMRGDLTIEVGDRFHLEHFTRVLREHISAVETDPSEQHLRALEGVSDDVFNELRRYTALEEGEAARLPVAVTAPVRLAKLLAHREKMAERAQRKQTRETARTIAITTPGTEHPTTVTPSPGTERLPFRIVEATTRDEDAPPFRVKTEEEMAALDDAERMQYEAALSDERERGTHQERTRMHDFEYDYPKVQQWIREEVGPVNQSIVDNEHRIRAFTKDVKERTQQDVRERTRAEETPLKRMQTLLTLRAKTYDALHALEEEAGTSFWRGLALLPARLRERRRLMTSTEELEGLYDTHPDLRKAVRPLLSPELQVQESKAEERKRAVLLFQQKKESQRELASRMAALEHNTPQQRLRSAINTPQIIVANHQFGAVLARHTKRIRELETQVEQKPAAWQRFLGIDPVAKEKRELASRMRQAQELLAEHPDLIAWS